MISAVAVETGRRPTEQELITAIKRNFGGLEGLDPVLEFGEFLPFIMRDMVMHLFFNIPSMTFLGLLSHSVTYCICSSPVVVKKSFIT